MGAHEKLVSGTPVQQQELLIEHSKPTICKYFKICKTKYIAILDLNVATYNSKALFRSSEYDFRCEIACLVRGQNKVHVFDILKPFSTLDRMGAKSLIFFD